MTPDLLGYYYASCDLPHSGASSPDRHVGAGATVLTIPLPDETVPDGFWNGATGYFCGNDTSAVLRGVMFHVRHWSFSDKTLTLAVPLPVAPVAGDIFKLFKGGKFASQQEIFNMKVSGKQPEVENVTGPNVTGVTIKKASAMLGEGTLTLHYNADMKAVSIHMGADNDGPEVLLTEDATNVAVYDSDLAGFVLVDIAFSLLPKIAATDTFTLTFPKGNFIPNYEGYETNDGVGRTRYHLVVLKNKGSQPITAISVWTDKPAGADTICTASHAPPSTTTGRIFVADAATWPTRGFWVRNCTKNDLRYIDYRSGNTLYAKPILWGMLPFQSGSTEILPGSTVTSSGTENAIVDQVVLSGGSWPDGDASGTLFLKKWTGSFSNHTPIYSNSFQCALTSATAIRGFRGTHAQVWDIGDCLELATDLDLGMDLPKNEVFKDPPFDTIAPNEIMFSLRQSPGEAAVVDLLEGGEMIGVWARQTILDGTQARTKIEGGIFTSWC